MTAYLVTSADRVDALGRLDDVHGWPQMPSSADQHQVAVEGDWAMDPDEIAVLLYQTTGEPKAAVLRHKHLVSYILSSVEFNMRRR